LTKFGLIQITAKRLQQWFWTFLYHASFK